MGTRPGAKDKSAEVEKRPDNKGRPEEENVPDELVLDSDEEMENLVDSINSFDPAGKK